MVPSEILKKDWKYPATLINSLTLKALSNIIDINILIFYF